MTMSGATGDEGSPMAIVAIPAKDEASRIGACLAALAMQRDADGAPLAAGAFAILVYANDCSDGTAEEAGRWAALSPHPIHVVRETRPAGMGSAGRARRRAMDLAASRLDAGGVADGLLLTTDADSRVAPNWVDATRRAIAAGADAVAGYVDGEAAELVSLGPAFLQRGRLEDSYLRCLAEIDALCDPRPHNPWPTHRVSSGATLAVTLDAYRAVGGLPDVPLGEDIAFTRALDRHGFRVRHAMDVTVVTSCRFDGRAAGGAADTMRERHAAPDLPCGDEIEPAMVAFRRATAKGRLRRAITRAKPLPRAWSVRLGVTPRHRRDETLSTSTSAFLDIWERIAAESTLLSPRVALRPSDLPAEIARAEAILRRLRALRPHGLSSLSRR